MSRRPQIKKHKQQIGEHMATRTTNFIQQRIHRAMQSAWTNRVTALSAVLLAGSLACAPAAMAQQAGGIKGKVETQATDISVNDVTVTASSNVMPKPRTVKTKADGSYVLPALKPGKYTLTFTSADGTVRQTQVDVLLDQTSNVDVAFEAAPTDSTEVIQIIGSRISREGDSSLTNSLGEDVLSRVPIGQDYRSL